MSDQTRAIRVDPDHAKMLLNALCEGIGFEVKDEYEPVEVATLMRHAGFAVTPATIPEFVRKGYIAEPLDPGAWDASAIYTLCAALASRRRFLPTPCVHDARKSGFRLQLETIIAGGQYPPINDLDQHSIEDLLIQLTECDDRPTREILYETLRLKIEGFEE